MHNLDLYYHLTTYTFELYGQNGNIYHTKQANKQLWNNSVQCPTISQHSVSLLGSSLHTLLENMRYIVTCDSSHMQVVLLQNINYIKQL